MLLLTLAACIDVGIIKQDDDPVFETGDTGTGDTAVDSGRDTGESGETAETADTNFETGDTSVDTAETAETADTSIDTSVDTGEDTGEDTGPPPPIVVDGVCTSGYPYTSWSDAAATEPELHIVGVYESQGGTGGPVTVQVTRTAEMVLALTSYSAVDWQIDLPASHDVTEILVSSYDASTWTFTGAGTAPVTYLGWAGACGYEIPDVNPHSGCETPDLQGKIERYTGLAMASFQGCYSGGDYAIEE